jgi:hypothetical protein
MAEGEGEVMPCERPEDIIERRQKPAASRLPNFRQVSARQDGHEAGSMPHQSGCRSGRQMSYRLRWEQVRATGGKP